MDHTQLEQSATAVFGITPSWTYTTRQKILDKCDRLGYHPAVYLRAFACNVKAPATSWATANCILSDKWDVFLEDMLNFMKEEANVKVESDAVAFVSLSQLEGSVRAALENEAAGMTATARVRYAKAYGLNDVAARWESDAYREALFNPYLPEAHSG